MSWKEKLKGYCKCFCGNDNSIGLIRNTEVCDCNASDLKLILQSTKYHDYIKIYKSLIKLGIYTKNELLQVGKSLGITSDVKTFYKAKQKLEKEEYHIFYDENKVVKIYDKNKI